MDTRDPFIRTEFASRRARVLCIGNFDGVHRGHERLLRDALDLAKTAGMPLGVLTFDPHPALALGRTPPPTLTTLPHKAELLVGLGVDEVLVQKFDDAFAALAPEQFVHLLVDKLGAHTVMVGENFRFGRARAGDLALMRKLGDELSFAVKKFEMIGDASGPYSSTRVRTALAAGDIATANDVLGRAHSFEGTIALGAQRGRTLGFPTANLDDVAEMVPARGVYAVRVGERGGVMNVGVRPTVGDSDRPSREVHIFDFEGDIYGKKLRVEVIARIRDEKKFGSLDELRAQIASDAERASEVLSRPA